MDFKFLTWYYDKGVPTPRDYFIILPIHNYNGFFGWKYSCWLDMPKSLNILSSFSNIEKDEDWQNKWKYQFDEGEPNLSIYDKFQIIKQLFEIVGK